MSVIDFQHRFIRLKTGVDMTDSDDSRVAVLGQRPRPTLYQREAALAEKLNRWEKTFCYIVAIVGFIIHCWWDSLQV